MPYHGSERCRGCSGEDCVCCEVYLEEVADQRSLALNGPPVDESWDDDQWDNRPDEDDEEEDDDPDDEDEEEEFRDDPLDEDDDTPLGHEYGDGVDTD